MSDRPIQIKMSRVGDFYEAYGDDADIVATVLQITVTERNGRKMTGIPAWAMAKTASDLAEQNIVASLPTTQGEG